MKALLQEIEIRSKNAESDIVIISPEEIIETIYFGGGTPSLLTADELETIINSIKNNYQVTNNPECTLEANPDDINLKNLQQWKACGINRLSIGIQSFIERDLQWMNRAHNAAQAMECITLAQEAGFTNFSIDLIFGTPGLSDEEWKQNIQKVIDLKVPHISSYALTVEPQTALKKMIDLHKREDIDTDIQANQYQILMQMLRDAGYEHYEISNFALPGFRSRHNSSYWNGNKYIGIGPSAHSYNGRERFWNKANNPVYIKCIGQNIIPFEKEVLTQNQKLEEYIMTSLRTLEGMDLQRIENNFSIDERKRIESVFENKIPKNRFEIKENKVILTNDGKLFADGIAVTLFK